MLAFHKKMLPKKSFGVKIDLEVLQRKDSSAIDNTLVDEPKLVIATEEPTEVRVEVVAIGDPFTGEGQLIEAVDASGIALEDPTKQGTEVLNRCPPQLEST